ncbi:MAG: NAD(P)/FAD-dependent oxidoreductase [Candidatus Marinimicrobia bacterium]|nr:NAD(P)/FAD-dependent oxidoreductase [Candidatus Neomarinimicrobiota bacterium]
MNNRIKNFDVIIIGAGASGLMCGISAGQRGRRVLVLDHGEKPGRKILISGGGRCNFTNYNLGAEHYISANPHFVKSALSRFSQWNILEMVNQHGIPYEERNFGQLFCWQSAKDLLNMLLKKLEKARGRVYLSASIQNLKKEEKYILSVDDNIYTSESLVIATGGITWKSAGATDFGLQIAGQFGLKVLPPQAGLVPLIWTQKDQQKFSGLSGISITAGITFEKHAFQDELLFTHHGLSGPAILQISNYWRTKGKIFIDFLPGQNISQLLTDGSTQQNLKNFLKAYLPERLLKILIDGQLFDKPVHQFNQKEIAGIHSLFHNFEIQPKKKASLEKAEVMLGGVDTREISSRNFESQKVPGLYFIGEILDVAGWLGGYNLQWAWSSGWCAGQYV